MEDKKSRQHKMGYQHRERRESKRHNHHHHHHHEPKSRDDVFVDMSLPDCEYKAAHVLALKQRVRNLRERVEALERHADEERARRNKLVLRELVKEARARIVEVNGLAAPSSKQSWKYCLHSLSPLQLQRANVNLKLWPELVEILSPSAVKLNDWVNGYTTWQAAHVIRGMDEAVQGTWGELFKVTHHGESFEDYSSVGEYLSVAEEDGLLDQE